MKGSEKLYSSKRIKRIMEESGLAFSKAKGQNFLIDGNVVRRIVEKSNVNQKDTVIEIGPGIGTLTQELLAHAGKVIAIELDRGFIPILDKNFGNDEKFNLMEGDALKIDLKELLSKESVPIKIVANLPYYITSPILVKLLTENLPIVSITVMVQKEVAERICAKKGTSNYGPLALLTKLYGSEAKILFKVPRTAFMPAPKVDSSVVSINMLDNKHAISWDLDMEEKSKINKIIRLAFQKRRKMVIKCFQKELGKKRNELLDIFEKVEVDPKARAEELSLDNFVNIIKLSGYLK